MESSDIRSEYMYKGCVDELPKDAMVGDIVEFEGDTYLYYDGKFEKVRYVDRLSEPQNMRPLVCERCGAPLRGNKCDYCGSVYGRSLDRSRADNICYFDDVPMVVG